MKNIIVGTSGHIDHGKTTLIKALTGRETDTLEEEKKRGISINLGFTYFDLPSGNRVGIIDVPGHERFIKNMLAGAAGIDIVLLVISAEEGVMPQTIEHMDILSYLNIHQGIIVLTKCDKVDDEFIELVKEDIKDRLSNSFLKDAPIVEVDSVSKRGIDKLVATIESMSQLIEEKNETSPPRLNIDRVFTIKGFGTVVTGTLLDGKISVNDELEIYPRELTAKIRSIQVHGENVDTAYAGQRTAINIANVAVSDLHRGDVLAAPSSLTKSMILDVKITLTNHTERTLVHWERLRLYHGAREILCRAVPLDTQELKKGETGFVQLRLEEDIICKKGDSFVVRTYSPVETIGGGTIIETTSKKHGAFDETILEALMVKEKGELKDILEEFLKQESFMYPTIKELLAYSGESKENIENALEQLKQEEKVLSINNAYIHHSHFDKLRDKTLKILEKFHKEYPLKQGISKEEIRSQVEPKFNSKDINVFVQLMERDYIDVANGLIYDKGFEIVIDSKKQKLIEQLSKEVEEYGYKEIQTIQQLSNNQKDKREVLEYMIGKQLELLGDDYVILTHMYQDAVTMVKNHIEKNGAITIGEFRDMTGSSRKNCLLLLENMDKKRITKRLEDKRVLV